MVTKRRNSLGRGLDALLGGVAPVAEAPPITEATPPITDVVPTTEAAPTAEVAPAAEVVPADKEQASESSVAGELKNIPLSNIQKGKYQPRTEFTEESLEELADSIRAQGVIQPIVTRSVGDNKYEIIAGERRWRAAKLAGLDSIPAIVRELPDEAALAVALIENIQREDLNPIEKASALRRLIDDCSLTHEQVANVISKSRTTVTNYLRLLGLEENVRYFVNQGLLDMGHARALLALDAPTQLKSAKKIISKGLSVRETEKLVARHQEPVQTEKRTKGTTPELSDLQTRLSRLLGTRVVIKQGEDGQGKMVVQYTDPQQLERLLERFFY